MANIALQDGKVALKDGKASCSCCEANPCSYPPVCFEGAGAIISGNSQECTATFNKDGCTAYITNDLKPFCSNWALVVSGGCFGSGLTNYFCKNDGIDSPIGEYYGINYGGSPPGYKTYFVTEQQEGIECNVCGSLPSICFDGVTGGAWLGNDLFCYTPIAVGPNDNGNWSLNVYLQAGVTEFYGLGLDVCCGETCYGLKDDWSHPVYGTYTLTTPSCGQVQITIYPPPC